MNENCKNAASTSHDTSNVTEALLIHPNSSRLDEQSHAEFLMHIQFYLSSNGFEEAGNLIKSGIESRGLVPKRYNFNGVPCPQTYEEFIRKMKPYSRDLLSIVERLDTVTSQILPPIMPNLPLRLFATKRQGLDRLPKNMLSKENFAQLLYSKSTKKFHNSNFLKILNVREFGTYKQPLPSNILLGKNSLTNLHLHNQIFGHLGEITCVAFDKTGRYIITCGYDSLIKVWDAYKCLLRYTFRGHIKQIDEIDISYDGTLLASGSYDKTLRVWNLQRGNSLFVFTKHTGAIRNVLFIPFLCGKTRYLVSAGNDCKVFFHQYNAKTKKFSLDFYTFEERAKSGSRIVSSCYSPGGNLVAMGDSVGIIRIFRISEVNVERLYEIYAHKKNVECLVWAHNNLRFASASKDGTVTVWALNEKSWTSISLDSDSCLSQTNSLPSTNVDGTTKAKKHDSKLLVWNLTDDRIVSTGADKKVRVWDWKSGNMLRVFNQNHFSYCILAHPIYEDLIFTAGDDGRLFAWDINTGKCLKEHQNRAENNVVDSIYNFVISCDGSTIATVNARGCLSILGIGSNQLGQAQPKEQFFSTDYFPNSTNPETGEVFDNQSGQLVHEMSLPTLISSHRDVYPDNIQRQLHENFDFENERFKTKPWENRQIIPEVSSSTLDVILQRQLEICKVEMEELKRCQINGVFSNLNPENRRLVPRERIPVRSPAPHESNPVNYSRQNIRAFLNSVPGEPRYVLPVGHDSEDSEDESYHASEESESQERLPTSSVPSTYGSAASNSSGEFDSQDDDDSFGRRRRRVTNAANRRRRPVNRVRRLRNQSVSPPSTRSPSSSSNTSSHVASVEATSPLSNYSSSPQQRLPVRRLDSVETEEPLEMEDLSQPSSSNNPPEVLAPQRRPRKRRQILSDGSETEEISMEPEGVLRAVPDEVALSEGQILPEPIDQLDESVVPCKQRKLAIQMDDSAVPSTSGIQAIPNNYGENLEVNKDLKAELNDNLDKQSVEENWAPIIRPIRFPFMAQLGDMIVYLKQGHQLYLKAVKNRNLFPITSKMLPRPDFADTEIFLVKKVSYNSSPRLIILLLEQYKDNASTGLLYELKYIDVENVADFLLLKQHFEVSVGYGFKKGDLVESLLDNRIYTGTVKNRTPFDFAFPNSEWLSVVVFWDDEPDVDDSYSPWDLRPKKENRITDVPADEKEIESWAEYLPQENDWTISDFQLINSGITISDDQGLLAIQRRDFYIERALKALNILKNLCEAGPANLPLEANKAIELEKNFGYALDLQTISNRLTNRFYRHDQSFLDDIQNFSKQTPFLDNSIYAKKAKAIGETICKFMSDFSICEIVPIFQIQDSNTNIELEQPCSSRTMFERDILKEVASNENKAKPKKSSKPKTIFSTDDEEIELFGGGNELVKNEISDDTQESATSSDQLYEIESDEENEENNSRNATPIRNHRFNDINEGDFSTSESSNSSDEDRKKHTVKYGPIHKTLNLTRGRGRPPKETLGSKGRQNTTEVLTPQSHNRIIESTAKRGPRRAAAKKAPQSYEDFDEDNDAMPANNFHTTRAGRTVKMNRRYGEERIL